MSSRLEKIKSDLNCHILDVINSAIEEKVLHTIRNVVGAEEGVKSIKWDLRSDGWHPNASRQTTQKHDHESDERQQNITCKLGQNHLVDFLRLFTIGSNREAHFRQTSLDSNYSEDDGYDTLIDL